jgi:hypothetical protein
MKLFKNKEKFVFNFRPDSQDAYNYFPEPKPAKNYYPEWVKQSRIKSTATLCPPFTDTFINGYIQELICDVKVDVEVVDGVERVKLSHAWDYCPYDKRSDKENSPNGLPEFYGYYHADFQWMTFWEPQTPKGYSTLYHHPSNRFDLPFHTMSGIIDTDVWPVSGPIPFLIKKGFTGVIPAGTPIYQMTFFKRNRWQSIKAKYDEVFKRKLLFKSHKYFRRGYKIEFWNKKDFL